MFLYPDFFLNVFLRKQVEDNSLVSMVLLCFSKDFSLGCSNMVYSDHLSRRPDFFDCIQNQRPGTLAALLTPGSVKQKIFFLLHRHWRR